MITTAATPLLDGLRSDLGQRRIGAGLTRLEEYWSKSDGFVESDPQTPYVLCYVAQWVDAGWRDIDIVQSGLRLFPLGRR